MHLTPVDVGEDKTPNSRRRYDNTKTFNEGVCAVVAAIQIITAIATALGAVFGAVVAALSLYQMVRKPKRQRKH